YLNDNNSDTDDDLGIDGIWLSPMMPSPSYHKYDVEDYYDIDKAFGTLDDFKELLAECKKRNIKVIIDLVLNHCSSEHPLFKEAVSQAKKGNYEDKAKYFSMEKSVDSPRSGYNLAEGTDNVWYESNFSPDMPEWDLSYGKTKSEIKKIANFWLDMGVDGFRLDAVKYFYFYDNQKSADFLKWFNGICKENNKNAYLVGEDWSTSIDEIKTFYTSGIDSLFAFNFADSGGKILSDMLLENGRDLVDNLVTYQEGTKEANKNSIDSYFISNHDMYRSADSLPETYMRKMAAATYMLIPGNSFIYYGEEIGIETYDEGDDPAKRTAMVWDSENLPKVYANGINYVVAPADGGVLQQEKDKDSLLNFYKKIIRIKQDNPMMARGKISSCDGFPEEICSYYVDYEDTRYLIIHNFSKTESSTLEITDEILKNAELKDYLSAISSDQKVTFEDGTLKLPPYSTGILKAE
ncbi:MAG: alpha-amylase family glycosyl hydrolase, partial [Acutalibacteraceae bacterium]